MICFLASEIVLDNDNLFLVVNNASNLETVKAGLEITRPSFHHLNTISMPADTSCFTLKHMDHCSYYSPILDAALNSSLE
jgi:hypothetical protein